MSGNPEILRDSMLKTPNCFAVLKPRKVHFTIHTAKFPNSMFVIASTAVSTHAQKVPVVHYAGLVATTQHVVIQGYLKLWDTIADIIQ